MKVALIPNGDFLDTTWNFVTPVEGPGQNEHLFLIRVCWLLLDDFVKSFDEDGLVSLSVFCLFFLCNDLASQVAIGLLLDVHFTSTYQLLGMAALGLRRVPGDFADSRGPFLYMEMVL